MNKNEAIKFLEDMKFGKLIYIGDAGLEHNLIKDNFDKVITLLKQGENNDTIPE